MQLKALTVVALATAVSAQVPSDVQASVAGVLLTAIPADTLSYALASSSAFSAELASSLAAGKTPEWYQALPTDVKTLLPQLYPASTPAYTTPVATSTPTPYSTTPAASAGTISAGPSGVNTTVISTVVSPTLSPTGAGPKSSSGPSSVSTGGASYPTAVVGAGLAGALGFLGMLAL